MIWDMLETASADPLQEAGEEVFRMDFLRNFILIFILVFIISVLVSFLYNLAVHGYGVSDWGISVRLGIVLGIELTWMMSRDGKRIEAD